MGGPGLSTAVLLGLLDNRSFVDSLVTSSVLC